MAEFSLRRAAVTAAISCTCVLAGLCLGNEASTDLLSEQDLRYFRETEQWTFVDSVSAVPGKTEFTLQGSGQILVNGAAKTRAPYLATKQEFGDVEVHLEFMVPFRSNAGVYLQGRYEIQIFDSYGVQKPKHSDLGGVYQRWDDNRDPKGYEGVPPRVNAAKKPGQWQTLNIVFRAPRFDNTGRKTENARFVKVLVNDRLVQQDQQVTGPTRAAQFTDEKPQGPILIQGDHGPLAIRSFTVKKIRLDQ
jgi:hypothetical protein